jgi:hypothetical protein
MIKTGTAGDILANQSKEAGNGWLAALFIGLASVSAIAAAAIIITIIRNRR